MGILDDLPCFNVVKTKIALRFFRQIKSVVLNESRKKKKVTYHNLFHLGL